MFGRRKDRRLRVSLDEPEFTHAEKQWVVGAMGQAVWAKVRKHAHWGLLCAMMAGRGNDDFRRGWLEACAHLDDLLMRCRSETAPADVKQEMTSMQGLEEEA